MWCCSNHQIGFKNDRIGFCISHFYDLTPWYFTQTRLKYWKRWNCEVRRRIGHGQCEIFIRAFIALLILQVNCDFMSSNLCEGKWIKRNFGKIRCNYTFHWICLIIGSKNTYWASFWIIVWENWNFFHRVNGNADRRIYHACIIISGVQVLHRNW